MLAVNMIAEKLLPFEIEKYYFEPAGDACPSKPGSPIEHQRNLPDLFEWQNLCPG